MPNSETITGMLRAYPKLQKLAQDMINKVQNPEILEDEKKDLRLTLKELRLLCLEAKKGSEAGRQKAA